MSWGDSRIRDGVRDSKILWDVSSKFDHKSYTFLRDPYEAVDGLGHQLKDDVRPVRRDLPRVSAVGIDDKIHHHVNRLKETNKRWIRSQLPIYGGTSYIEDLYEWIDAAEEFFEEMKTPERVRCKMASYALDGKADAWWRQLQFNRLDKGKSEVSSWSHMKHLLINDFLPTTCSIKCPIRNRKKGPGERGMYNYSDEFYYPMASTVTAVPKNYVKQNENERVVKQMMVDKFMPNKCSTKLPNDWQGSSSNFASMEELEAVICGPDEGDYLVTEEIEEYDDIGDVEAMYEGLAFLFKSDYEDEELHLEQKKTVEIGAALQPCVLKRFVFVKELVAEKHDNCSTKFPPDLSSYEHDNEVSCEHNYELHHSISCIKCNDLPPTVTFVEAFELKKPTNELQPKQPNLSHMVAVQTSTTEELTEHQNTIKDVGPTVVAITISVSDVSKALKEIELQQSSRMVAASVFWEVVSAKKHISLVVLECAIMMDTLRRSITSFFSKYEFVNDDTVHLNFDPGGKWQNKLGMEDEQRQGNMPIGFNLYLNSVSILPDPDYGILFENEVANNFTVLNKQLDQLVVQNEEQNSESNILTFSIGMPISISGYTRALKEVKLLSSSLRKPILLRCQLTTFDGLCRSSLLASDFMKAVTLIMNFDPGGEWEECNDTSLLISSGKHSILSFSPDDKYRNGFIVLAMKALLIFDPGGNPIYHRFRNLLFLHSSISLRNQTANAFRLLDMAHHEEEEEAVKSNGVIRKEYVDYGFGFLGIVSNWLGGKDISILLNSKLSKFSSFYMPGECCDQLIGNVGPDNLSNNCLIGQLCKNGTEDFSPCEICKNASIHAGGFPLNVAHHHWVTLILVEFTFMYGRFDYHELVSTTSNFKVKNIFDELGKSKVHHVKFLGGKELVVKNLKPAGGCCSLKKNCTNDHFWKKHVKQRWVTLIEEGAYVSVEQLSLGLFVPRCNVQTDTGINLTRGRVIQWAGWNDENYTTMGRKLNIREISVMIGSCVITLCKNGQSRESVRLFHKLVNGVDPPIDLHGL